MKRYLWVLPAAALALAAAPTSVTLTGSFQSELGCTIDNDPVCTNTDLAYSAANDKWTGSFSIPAGTFSYQATLNHTTPSYPGTAINITGTGAAVKFYYDDATHWVGDSKGSVIATAAGDFQSELGCGGDWDPACLRSMLTDADGDGVYTFSTTNIPAGSWNFKVAYNEKWDESYGAGGGSNNISFKKVAGAAPVVLAYVPGSHQTFISGPVTPGNAPARVTVPGSLDSEIGCSGDWDPGCAQADLTYSPADDLWTKSVASLPVGSYEYKVALNGTWDVNYGRFGVSNGGNIPLVTTAIRSVKWYYDDKTHVIADNVNSVIYTAVGNFQKLIGCASNNDATCLRGWMPDPDEDGTYDMVTPPLPPGTYSAQAATAEGAGATYGDCANGGAAVSFTVPQGPPQPVYLGIVNSTHCLTPVVGGRPKGGVREAHAHWLAPDVFAWDTTETPDSSVVSELYVSPTAGIQFQPTGVSGGTTVALTYDPAGLPAALKTQYPNLKSYKVWHFTGGPPANVKDLLKGQVVISMKSGSRSVDASAVQTAGVLDALYAANAKSVALGATWSGGAPTLRVWAPTAQDVKLELYADAASATTPAEQPMTLDQNTGVWSVPGQAAWKGQYYTYKATVFTRDTRQVVVNEVPDPYSVDVSINAGRSHLIDLADAANKPANWDALPKPALASPLDIVLYELHVRDFSATDATVPSGHRGKYLAFTDASSDGMKHLQALAAAGLTHVHLLPAFDIASVDENAGNWQPIDFAALAAMPPDSQNQQAYAAARQDNDGFNWGYDPVLFGAPEGSYATDPNGGKRVIEFRQMVQGLNAAGLRVVMDVVYNHTNSSGQDSNSVLDKIVPGYYYRLNPSGDVTRDSCCRDTASEHAMMAKLTVDTLVTWAREFKVSGFRFDLMGFMPKQVLVDAQTALKAVDPAMYLYGEGWDFGDNVGGNLRFTQAKQAELAGTGIGTFNDRIRDAVRGGSPFTPITDQGFATGLLTDQNAAAAEIGNLAQKGRLLAAQDLIRLSLAGNLKDYDLQDSSGATVKGAQLSYNGNPGAGYTGLPQESINYVSAHDNTTLFDAVQVKAKAGADLATRIRYNNLALAIVMLSQGVPFFHAGDEILRSKSGDNNSYNSGDWFNRIDWSLATNGWGSGLPIQSQNGSFWSTLRPLLGNTDIRPGQADMQFAMGVFTDFLKIRKQEPVLRLATAQAIQKQVSFYDTGTTQQLGLIVEKIGASADGTAGAGDLVILYNGTPDGKSWQSTEYVGQNYELHAVQKNGTDDVVKAAAFHPLTGQFTVPGRTVAVFRNMGGTVDKLLPEPIVPTCACATSGTTSAAGLVLLALATLWRRRRATLRHPSTLARY